jgi:hypothetical protein
MSFNEQSLATELSAFGIFNLIDFGNGFAPGFQSDFAGLS